MKKLFTILAVIIYIVTYYDVRSQTYNGALYEMFFGSEPSARAEGMGKHLSAVTGDALSYYYNPAGMASLKGLNLNAAFAGPYYTTDNKELENSYFDFFSASYNIKKYGTAGLSADYFKYSYDRTVYDEFGNARVVSSDFSNTIYRLTLSSEVIKDLYVGLNLNLLNQDNGLSEFTVANEKGNGSSNVFYFDLGVLKSFKFNSKKLDQSISLGTSVINVNTATFSLIDAAQGEQLPVIFRLGASYDLSVNDRSISSKLKSYKFLVDAEYEDLFNSKYYGGFHGGFEFTFLEILSLRAGFYSQENVESMYSFDTTSGIFNINVGKSENDISEFTYGLGLNIPIKQLTDGKTPIEIKFDYANLNQPSYKKDKDSPGKFHVYTIIFKWEF